MVKNRVRACSFALGEGHYTLAPSPASVPEGPREASPSSSEKVSERDLIPHLNPHLIRDRPF
jgi:hypothetical protein